jgi:hypothetical protein
MPQTTTMKKLAYPPEFTGRQLIKSIVFSMNWSRMIQ